MSLFQYREFEQKGPSLYVSYDLIWLQWYIVAICENKNVCTAYSTGSMTDTSKEICNESCVLDLLVTHYKKNKKTKCVPIAKWQGWIISK